VVCVAVHDEIRTVLADRSREPLGAEHEPEPLGLADQRLGRRRVVQQRDAQPATGDRLQAAVERLDVPRRLRVRLAEKRLAEVRPAVLEAADESLHGRDADADTPDRQDRVRALEDDDARLAEGAREVAGAVGLPVVVAEHGDNRDRETAARLAEDAGLVDLAVLRQVARQQYEIGAVLHVCERLADAIRVPRCGVDVGRGGDPHTTGCIGIGLHGYGLRVASDFETLLSAMRKAAGALRDAHIPFALAGSIAVYAHGGPDTDHDVDFLVKPEDADRALEALSEAGFRVHRPAEGWLYKALDPKGAWIDVIYEPTTGPVTDELLSRAQTVEVHAIHVPVLSPTDVLTSKLLALREHNLDFAPMLEIARSLREQIDWDELRRRTDESAYAKPFFTLVEELGLAA